MRNSYKLSSLLLFFVLGLLISCASKPENKIDSVYIMIYDYDNNPVMDVSVMIDDKLLGNTDIYGRFSFPVEIVKNNNEKNHAIKVKKEGFESGEMSAKLQAGEVLYFKIGTGLYYAERAEELLDKNDLDKALKMINHALEIEERKDWKYLKEIIIRRISK